MVHRVSKECHQYDTYRIELEKGSKNMLSEETLIAVAIVTWKSNLERANKLFGGLDESALENQVAPGRNRLVYLWGHLASTHDRMLQLLGIAERVHPEFDAVFLSSPDGASTLPPIDVMREWWAQVNHLLDAGLHDLTLNDWVARHTAVSEEDFAKEPLRNRFSILITRTNHLAYHVGQAVLATK